MANWEGVSEFVAVAETESFTSAANKLNTSVAQVSRKVSALENRLATKLLNRTTRRVSVTEAGQLYYQHCRQVIDGLEQAERVITNMQSVPQGKLKVTAPVTYGEQRIAPLLNQFMTLYPQLELQLVLTNQKLDLIEQGVDLAIRLGRLDDSSMMAKRLASRQLYVCAAPSYLKDHGEPHTLSELSQHNCLLGSMDYWRFREVGKERNVRVQGNIRCNSGSALTDAALKGLGIVQLPDYYVEEHIESGELVELLPLYREEQEGIWALYPHNRHLSTKVRSLVDFLREQFESQ
ncbi:LysR substrate-binding domain-containing protein [Vibrio sp. Of7-15]|uniref:LysR substrate-binding domain-containing protein n=1 Tax=Vibrio sp. Of7-15 TaxID=2724879 RepID=UPI001EF192F5|nr:LysR substrate-binding domain-containing protein [Vibrio sp. Of7-15]MCG7498621.1 LysR substrate-binding domain-containing protein [Vibrio sp. Of7-15]